MKCPECEKEILPNDWIETESGCEDCGSHEAFECPECSHLIDFVYDNDVFEEIENLRDEN